MKKHHQNEAEEMTASEFYEWVGKVVKANAGPDDLFHGIYDERAEKEPKFRTWLEEERDRLKKMENKKDLDNESSEIENLVRENPLKPQPWCCAC